MNTKRRQEVGNMKMQHTRYRADPRIGERKSERDEEKRNSDKIELDLLRAILYFVASSCQHIFFTLTAGTGSDACASR